MKTPDITGQRFGRLVAISRFPDTYPRWRCVCDCGRETILTYHKLITGNTKSCGCLHRDDITGRRYGILTVLGRFPDTHPFWRCLCECGNEVLLLSGKLKSGQSKSCGCLHLKHLKSGSIKHGHAPQGKPSRTYRIWQAMRRRCKNPNSQDYPYYGGRGISVCSRWNSFQNFLADMGEAPDALTLDRINNEGNYEPDNCRWTTRREQRANTRPFQPFKPKQKKYEPAAR